MPVSSESALPSKALEMSGADVKDVPVRHVATDKTSQSVLGAALPRKEDLRLVTGRGFYVDDVRRPGMLFVAFARSIYPHAQVRSVESASALGMPGVLRVVVPGDIAELGEAMPELIGAGTLVNRYVDHFRIPPHRLLPEKVSYVGEQYAIVVADSPYTAADGAAALEADYQELPAVTSWEQSYSKESSQIHEGFDNITAHLKHKVGDVDSAIAEADIAFEERHELQSLRSMAIECRAVAAEWDRTTETLTVWTTCHLFYMVRDALCRVLGLPHHQVRVMSRDTGGSFGLKGVLYPEDLIVPILAKVMDRPMRWSETRLEHMISSNQSGIEVHDVRVGATKEGRITALDVKLYKDVGAYNHFEMVLQTNTVNHMPTHYRIPNMRFEGWALATNSSPGSPFRGAGRIEATFTMDRVLDGIARRAGLDPAHVRAINLIRPEDMPYRNGLVYRDGVDVVHEDVDYPHMLKTALQKSDYDGWRSRQAAMRKEGRAIGIGISSYVEAGGIGPGEYATVRIDDSGRVFVSVGVNCAGQSHETTLAQACAHVLGAKFENITVLGGDTSLQRAGFGTGASRVAVNAGNAVALASGAVRVKALALAAKLFECDVEDVIFADGVVSRRHPPERSMSLGELARFAGQHRVMRDPEGPGLAATEFFAPRTVVWSSGVHVAVVEVDTETGRVHFLRYVVVHDCGVPLNIQVVEGQIVGGVVQGLSIALGEEARYDDNGQVLTGSFSDYYVPRCEDAPEIELHHLVYPSSNNPLGIKAVGESGPISPPAAVAAAVEDALEGRLHVTRLPITAGSILQACRESAAVSA